jgi:hypothetical protein
MFDTNIIQHVIPMKPIPTISTKTEKDTSKARTHSQKGIE